MASSQERRLAGFSFEAILPELPEKLPRMDIAVFVGFAEKGRLDEPIPLEDVESFQEEFGADLELVWDAKHNRTVYAHLGPSVRAFFRNGGRRCWVVRVAHGSDFSAAPFLDGALIKSTASTLLSEADFIRYERPNSRKLRGIHAALEIEEATLIAVPDAVHIGWKPTESASVPTPDRSEFLPHQCWGLSETCDFEPKPPGGEQPRYDKFLNCDLRLIEPPALDAPDKIESTGTFTLSWHSDETDLTFVLEEATRSDLSDAREIYRGKQLRFTIHGRPAGHYFYRVRAEAGCETSNWSNEISVSVSLKNRNEERPPESFKQAGLAGLLDIHRSVLRMCAARGDLFAVLALPEHFRTDDCLDYVRQLKSPSPSAAAAEESTLPIGQGESSVFSYGALYHPWLVTREGDGELIHSPPDGAATGIIARRSLERGAWIAPANERFLGTIALNPPLRSRKEAESPPSQTEQSGERLLALLVGQINQVAQEPDGFLALNADTLSIDPELRPINVRRLLILLRREALHRGARYVFEPNGGTLRRLVQSGFESLLDQLFFRGAFAGATRATSYEVVTDDSINTPQTRDLGQFRVDLKVAPSLPMSFLTVRLVQTGEQGIATELI